MTLERLTQITSVGISSGITLSSATLTGVTTRTTLSAGGDIDAVNGTFSGDLNVAGTLTYEDVTNIDAIGLITARSGVQVDSGGIDVTGVITSTGNISGSSTSTGSFGNIQVAQDFLPTTDNNSDLGAADKRWANIYSADLQLSNEGTEGNEVDGTTGNWTLQEGEDDLFLLNRKNGKKYRFKLEEIT